MKKTKYSHQTVGAKMKIEALESAAKMVHLAHHQNQKKHLRGADAWTRG